MAPPERLAQSASHPYITRSDRWWPEPGEAMPKSDLPFGSEFSPTQIDLRRVLELAHEYGGDWRVFEDAIYQEYFQSYPSSDYNKRKLANNTKLSMQAYGILDKDANLTEFGRRLYDIRENEHALHDELARHILLNLNGAMLIQCVLDMEAAGEPITLVGLRKRLEKDYNLHFPRGGKHPSIMRLWLEKAGVIVGKWRVDRAKFSQLLGKTPDELDALAMLSPEQKAFLRALANIGGMGPYPSNEIEKLASATYGVQFNEKSLPKQVLYPLADRGYITLKRGTKEAGRGAKPFLVTPTDKLVADVVDPILEQLERQTHGDVRPLLRRPLSEIIAELDDEDRHIRGLALEALAFKLMRLIDLDYVATRLRGPETGGAEADLIFESARLVFSRWQIQCKNTNRVSLDAVAKEVGLTHMLKSNVIVMVSTGNIGQEARMYANLIMKESNLCIVMVDRHDIARIENNPAAIVDVLNREAEHAMSLKKLEL